MKSVIGFLLRGYKRWISPMLPHACRFTQPAVRPAGVSGAYPLAIAELISLLGFYPGPMVGLRHGPAP